MNAATILNNKSNLAFRPITVRDVDGDYTVTALVVAEGTADCGELIGSVKIGVAFELCRGKRYVGDYGRSPVYAGGDSDVWFSTLDMFDGEWTRGVDLHAGSGSGDLYAAVAEAFRVAGLLAD